MIDMNTNKLSVNNTVSFQRSHYMQKCRRVRTAGDSEQNLVRSIEKTVKAYVADKLAGADEDLRVTCVMPAFPVYVAAGELTLTVLRHQETQGQRTVCEVALSVDGHLERVLLIPADLRPMRRVWGATRKLLRGDR